MLTVNMAARLLSIVAAPIFLASCKKVSKDGLSYVGQLVAAQPFGEKPSAENLVDAVALHAKLVAIEEAAPPVNYEKPSSLDRRAAYIRENVDHGLGRIDPTVVLSCINQTGPNAMLSFSDSDRNLAVNLFTRTSVAQQHAAELSTKLSSWITAQFRLDLVALSRGGMGVSGMSPLDGVYEREISLLNSIKMDGLTAARIRYRLVQSCKSTLVRF